MTTAKENTTRTERIKVILDRAHDIVVANHLYAIDRMQLSMTLIFGLTLKELETLLKFDDSNFMHDVGGILRYYDFNTNEFKECFSPRCSG